MRISLAFFTWSPEKGHARSSYALESLNSFLSLIKNRDIHIHIADDGSHPKHREDLVKICEEWGFTPSVTNSERGGYGKSYNLMMQACHDSSDYIFCLEDDWRLTRQLDLNPLVEAMEKSEEINCIRLGYLGFTRDLRGKLINSANQTFLLFDSSSEEPHIFTGHPRLEKVAFQKLVGVWPEGRAAGDTEWEIAHRFYSRKGVVWPMDMCIPASQSVESLFTHIGSVGVGEVVPESANA